ncbi:MAG: hypothetical protein DSM107014_15020 [Gomphosphaeria aponina SAG 52.96 = DSM 107014]|uniref:Uncharacterized protein n=1 Tax=Gomphosphaeria aponina SAG 52.96 = DSM 107014 TaxID=1521640 RepID=A0A941JNC6_9CHRO|nr:hypothetical protein [Gomphosphaeria aponina SAG 52.96 = DSM 107014]
MFGKQQNSEKKEATTESQQPTMPQVQDLIPREMPAKIKNPWEESMEEEIKLEVKPEIVNIVEKISGILSPYFIVIVGLYLYENNFLLGTLLIVIGIVSLLKVSFKDVKKWIEGIKKSLGYGQEL